MGKQGMDLSINFIIVAAIAILVMVVLIAIFAGRARDFNKWGTCSDQNGKQADKEGRCDEGSFKMQTKEASGEYIDCCIPLNQGGGEKK